MERRVTKVSNSKHGILESKHTADMAKNHRKRVRERFLKGGRNSFDEYQLMEMLLFEFIPRIDTYPIAHDLIDTFGSISGVLSADPDELVKIDGIGKKTAERLILRGELTAIIVEKEMTAYPFAREENIIPYLSWTLKRFPTDTVCIVYLDKKNRFIDRTLKPATDDMNRELLEEIKVGITINNPAKVVLAHKHPDGDLKPSPDDLYVTTHFIDLCRELGVTAVAHYIVSGQKVVNIMDGEKE